jgi:hypothetical protein
MGRWHIGSARTGPTAHRLRSRTCGAAGLADAEDDPLADAEDDPLADAEAHHPGGRWRVLWVAAPRLPT